MDPGYLDNPSLSVCLADLLASDPGFDWVTAFPDDLANEEFPLPLDGMELSDSGRLPSSRASSHSGTLGVDYAFQEKLASAGGSGQKLDSGNTTRNTRTQPLRSGSKEKNRLYVSIFSFIFPRDCFCQGLPTYVMVNEAHL
jgi:hypothetical protein